MALRKSAPKGVADMVAAGGGMDLSFQEEAPVAVGSDSRLSLLVAEALDLRNDILPKLKAAKLSAEERYDELRKNQIPEAMRQLGLVDATGHGSFTHSSGAKVHLGEEFFAHVRKEDKPELFKWLRRRKHGDLITEDVHAGTLKAFIKEQRLAGKPLPPNVQINEGVKAVFNSPKKGDASGFEE